MKDLDMLTFFHNLWENEKFCFSKISIQNCVTSSAEGWDQRLQLIKSRVILEICSKTMKLKIWLFL